MLFAALSPGGGPARGLATKPRGVGGRGSAWQLATRFFAGTNRRTSARLSKNFSKADCVGTGPNQPATRQSMSKLNSDIHADMRAFQLCGGRQRHSLALGAAQLQR
jgi:hypothetical protein